MAEPELCQRCSHSIEGPRFVLRVEADDHKLFDMVICTNCMDSFRLWETRRQRHREGGESTPKGLDNLTTRSGRGRKKPSISDAQRAREREVAGERVRVAIICGALLLLGGGIFGLALSTFMK